MWFIYTMLNFKELLLWQKTKTKKKLCCYKLTLYNTMTEINCIRLYIAMKLNNPKLVTKAQRPSLISSTTQLMLPFWYVKGATIDASVRDSEIPTWAAFRAW